MIEQLLDRTIDKYETVPELLGLQECSSLFYRKDNMVIASLVAFSRMLCMYKRKERRLGTGVKIVASLLVLTRVAWVSSSDTSGSLCLRFLGLLLSRNGILVCFGWLSRQKSVSRKTVARRR